TWTIAITVLQAPATASPHHSPAIDARRLPPSPAVPSMTIAAAPRVAMAPAAIGAGNAPSVVVSKAAKATHAAAPSTAANAATAGCGAGGAIDRTEPQSPSASSPLSTVGDGGALNASSIGLATAKAMVTARTRSSATRVRDNGPRIYAVRNR